MSRSRFLFLAVSGALVLTILSGTLHGAPTAPGDDGSLYKYLSVFTEVLRLVRQAYVDETDLEALMNGALDGAPDALDPFSVYVPESARESYLEARRLGVARSGVRIARERGVAYVVAVQEGGPAAKAGLRQGDIVSSVDGESTRETPLWKIERALAAAPGTKVELEVLRTGESHGLELELADFEPEAPSVETFQDVPILRIPVFAPETPLEVGQLLGSIEGDELMIDLRGVAFGEVERGYEVAKLFAEGDLGFLKKRDQELESWKGSSLPRWHGATVLLVDRGTQGAAEVFAQVLRQRAGAKLVGQPTFGFAGRSKLVELQAGGTLVLTEAFFTGPDGEPVREGIEPDVVVGERARTFKELNETLDDLILERAIDVLRETHEVPEKKAA